MKLPGGGRALDHTPLYGPPGLIRPLGRCHRQRNGGKHPHYLDPPLKSREIWPPCSPTLNPGDILFIDEIHRLEPVVEEILYPAMEDYAIDIIVGKGPSANSIRLTCLNSLWWSHHPGRSASGPGDRFGVSLRLELYTTEESWPGLSPGRPPC